MGERSMSERSNDIEEIQGPGLPDFSWYRIPKIEKSTKGTQKCTKCSKNIPEVRKILHMDTKYVNIFQSKALQNLPKLVFLV
jgi:hypothetical protein